MIAPVVKCTIYIEVCTTRVCQIHTGPRFMISSDKYLYDLLFLTLKVHVYSYICKSPGWNALMMITN